ncbi:A disintegrin and metalloproteinase with thrombospondin motifs 7-like [Mercenaria mercenaria]|uniref:A disintegrin and metalloproteinase with thrombospondin motifs 7-like n=1 Tax=Mercenaria mercenaria TaxID=6596 RepID=UPI00234F3AA8|nr:A disintegrin and metalloproteinase with thrombospondin motifs 7-like [Mercenaria mercenaria]
MNFTFLVFTVACLIFLVRCNRLPQLLSDEQSKPTDHSEEPDVQYAAVKEIDTSDLRPFRKRAANVVQYQISLDNETFTITLRPNKNIFTPGCLIHNYLPGGKKDLYPCSRQSVDCYYIGHSDVHDESWVAANVCNGLNGVISFGNTSRFIEPVAVNASAEAYQDKVHVVYRYQGDKQICPIEAEEFENELHVAYGRQKRSAKTRYIETRLVVDPTMYHFHRTRDNAIDYTLMAFNIASKLYTHPSIGAKIYLTLSELHVIQTYNDFASELTENANKTLRTFCDWQSGLKTKKVDCSVLLTRLDLEDDYGNSGINGLAHLNKMCNKNLRCALVEDEGPIMGITLAHEIGHLLGMTHDKETDDVGIMSAGGWSGNEAFTWSNQSAIELQRSFASRRLTCIKNRPNGFVDNRTEFPLPGTLYTADQQCKMRSNESYVFYRAGNNKFDPCRNIICRFQGNQALRFSSPLLDGTDCNNTRMWCIQGKCQPIDKEHESMAPVDGSWSAWETDYSACSRSCGGGVQIKRRYCNNPPPQYAGKDCPGSSTRGKICNIQPCDSDYRTLQCSRFSMEKYSLSMIPALGSLGDESCSERCQSDTAITYGRKSYADGTECLLNKAVPFSRCVNGKCQDFGCDGYSSSGLKYDECGVCNGKGTTCKQIFGTYHEDYAPHKYINVTTIPAGSSGIRLQQYNKYCFLSMVVDGKRILNAGMEKSRSALFNLYGVQFRYIDNPETIEIVGKITKDVEIQVFRFYDYHSYVNVTPDVTYTYHIPSPQAHQLYAWAEIPNTSCSLSCGTGITTKDIKCMSVSGDFVDDYHCDFKTRPKKTYSRCNTQPCPPSWKTLEWGQCSVPCGNGTKTRSVSCVSMTNGVDKVVSSAKCNDSLKPHLTSRCINICGWRKGNWSKCSRSCGEGYRTRSVSCLRYSGTDTEIDSKFCDQHTRPDDTDRCRNGPCYVLDGNCVDKSPVCEKYYDYEKTACDGNYSTWMMTNCLQTCGFCGNGSCEDEETCKRVDPGVDACHNPQYKIWMQTHCPHSCNICRDCVDCSKYDVKYCKDNAYERFMRKNCRKSCNFC